MERSIVLGGNEYKYKINFKMSYDFLKYRNRITKGFDFSKADKKVVEEIVSMQEKLQEKQKNGQTSAEDLSFLNDLSSEAMSFLTENSKNDLTLFSQEEILDIVGKFTGIKEESAVEEILDREIEQNGIDELIPKLINSISEVFINAKANSTQKQVNKMELEKVTKN